jgi:mono/diheme cytochrome c family protein
MKFGSVAACALLLAGCGGGGGGGDETVAGAPDPKRGRAIVIRSGCIGCHSIPSAGINRRHVGPDLDLVAKKYDAAFIRRSIVKPGEYLEKGSEGKIGGKESYGFSMPPYGPEELPPQHLSEQEPADIIAFLESAAAK